MHDEPTFGSQVSQRPPPRASRRARRWPRLLAFAFLTVLMLVVLGGTSRASELDPNETVTGALDPVVETVTDTLEPVVETVEPVVETVTDTVEPIVETATDTVDPVIGTVTDTIDPVVDLVISPTRGIVGTGGADPFEPLPSPGVIVPDPQSAGGIADGEGDDWMTSFDRRGQLGGDLTWSPYSTTMVPSSGGLDLQPADTATGGGSTGLPSLPLGGRGAGSSVTLLFMLAALTMSVRAFKPPFLSSIVPRAVPMLGATLALSVERPG